MKRVPVNETVFRLCQAIKKLETVNKVLEYPAPIDHAIDDIHESILDLCGLPADNSADGDFEKPDLFVRENFGEELDTFLETMGQPQDVGLLLERFRRQLVRVADPRN